MKAIPLTMGQETVVDDEDFAWASRYKWYAVWDKKIRGFYAVRYHKDQTGRRWTIKLHREILGLGHGDKRQGDHIETGQTLDNRRCNLRILTIKENCRNKGIYKNNSSGFSGVSFKAAQPRKPWMASIRVDYKRIHIGYFPTKEEAAEAAKAARIKYFGSVCAASREAQRAAA